MQEVRGRARRGQGRRDLAADVARLPHAGDDHPPRAAIEDVDRVLEALVDLRQQAQDRLGLDAQDALGQAAQVAARCGAHDRSSPARIASS
jgi:hypothetical protein